MSNLKEEAEQILKELNELSKGEIFPKSKIDDEKNIYYIAFLKLLNKPKEDEEEYETKLKIYNKLNDFVKLIIKDDLNFYDTILDFANKKFEDYKKRQKLHYLYNCEVGLDDQEGNEKRFKVYEMSVFKAQVENGMYPDENYYKNIPDWMIDIKNFTDIIIPLNCQTVFIYNPEQKAVVDLRKDELFLIP
jgi:hypothetical protein